MPYARAIALQERLRQELISGAGSEHLLLLEHPHVFTLGRSAAPGDILVDREWLQAHEVEIAETDRGGQVTYHGPGQLVGYPVIDLKPDRRDIRRYVRDLQEVLVRTLGEYGIEAEGAGEQELIGVWARRGKIASIGVHLSRWITTHGFALNVTTDLDFFRAIVPCGLPEAQMASIASLTGVRRSVADVAACLSRHFAEVFDRDLELAAPEADVAAADADAGRSAHDRTEVGDTSIDGSRRL